MSVNVPFNGETHVIPAPGEKGWGAAVTAFIVAVGAGALTAISTLAAELDLGATYGIRAKWFRSQSSNPAATGVGRLARADTLSWRNQANGADLALGPGSDNLLEFAGVDLVDTTTAQTLNAKTLTNSPSVAPGTLVFGMATGPGTTGNMYAWPGFSSTVGASTEISVPMPMAGKLIGFQAVCTAAPAADMVISIRKNGSQVYFATMLSGALTATSASTSTFVAGDRIGVMMNLAGTATAATNVRIAIQYTQA